MKWQEYISKEIEKTYFKKIMEKVNELSHGKEIIPDCSMMFNCFNYFSINETKVVILGQDPYPNKDHSNGLCFSVSKKVKTLPPSLLNIFRALEYDLGIKRDNPDLSDWAMQGVLLLNTVLTTNINERNSHKNVGYDEFIANILNELSKVKNVVYFLWGKKACSYEKLIDSENNLILKSVHPSPLSFYRGFLFNKHFSAANDYLFKNKRKVIKW
ncbi:uracil-DNA glycosylase [Ureaplasma canigenitalium]|uniref:uracil-DNA glycosylase n=1 Tax=Ureaplasma canigenitalium TaxID=42092 RepID=UPI0004E246E6|nr:uracil-DNA glycosylase [Ureaplasma canigenitalium]